MLVLAVAYVVEPGRERDAVECLKQLVAETRKEPGNRAYVALRSKDDPRTFFIYEEYDDEAALEAHRASDHFQRYGKNGLQTMAQSRRAKLYVPLTEPAQ